MRWLLRWWTLVCARWPRFPDRAGHRASRRQTRQPAHQRQWPHQAHRLWSVVLWCGGERRSHGTRSHRRHVRRSSVILQCACTCITLRCSPPRWMCRSTLCMLCSGTWTAPPAPPAASPAPPPRASKHWPSPAQQRGRTTTACHGTHHPVISLPSLYPSSFTLPCHPTQPVVLVATTYILLHVPTHASTPTATHLTRRYCSSLLHCQV